MRREAEFFADREPALIYIAPTLHDAQRLESVLDERGVDYAVEPDLYLGGVALIHETVGAFFYVDAGVEAVATEAMRANGFRPFASGAA